MGVRDRVNLRRIGPLWRVRLKCLVGSRSPGSDLRHRGGFGSDLVQLGCRDDLS
jgi:hypothetical protein